MIRKVWNFIIIILPVVASVAPLWFYYSDARSLRVQIISKTSLQPSTTAHALPGLTISLEGQELEKPYLTVLEIINDGGREIPASAFESPLEIKTQDSVKVARAEVTVVSPRDIQPKIERGQNVLKLQPLLLNKSDSIRIAFITSGGFPEFSSRGRIEGITSIPIEDTGVKLSEWRRLFQVCAGFALLIVYIVNLHGALERRHLGRVTMVFISLSSLFAGVFLLLNVAFGY